MTEPTPTAAVAEQGAPNPAPLAVVAFLAPWGFVSSLLPDPWRWLGFACVTLLALLLVAASAWSHRVAHGRGEDATHWAFLTVLTFGAAMIVLATRQPRTGLARICVDCGREGDGDEPFCFGCGSQA